MNTIEEPVIQTHTSGAATVVSDIQLSTRQTEFLQRARRHDASVKVFALGEQLYFRGRSMSGLMPSEATFQTDQSDTATDEEVKKSPDTARNISAN